jgi:hypothetical protein
MRKIFKTLKNLKLAVSWDIAPCILCIARRFGITYHLHLQGRKSADQETSVQQAVLYIRRWPLYLPQRETVTVSYCDSFTFTIPLWEPQGLYNRICLRAFWNWVFRQDLSFLGQWPWRSHKSQTNIPLINDSAF